MELRHLKYFIAVADELHFTRAAQKLHLSQPSLTRQIRNLEDELGVLLLQRDKHHVSLTEKGANFLVDARRMMQLSAECITSARRVPAPEIETLQLGCEFRSNAQLLKTALHGMNHRCPETSVVLLEMSPSHQLRALEERQIDLGFVGWRPQQFWNQRTSLHWECVAHHAATVLLPVDDPLARESAIRMTDLDDRPFVALSEKSHPGSRFWLNTLCQPKIIQEAEHESGVLDFVRAGLGVSIMRDPIQNFAHPGVTFRPLAIKKSVAYWVAWHQENRSQPLARLLEILQQPSSS